MDRYFTSLKTLILVSTCGLFILRAALLVLVASLSNRFRRRNDLVSLLVPGAFRRFLNIFRRKDL
jgi:hypothetical protein